MREPYWIDRLDEKMVGGEPTVKDVCQECNNVVLSQLDSYGLKLYKNYFCKIAEQNEIGIMHLTNVEPNGILGA